MAARLAPLSQSRRRDANDAHRQADQGSDTHHLPRIVAHKAVGSLTHLLGLVAKLDGGIRHGALGGQQRDFHLRAHLAMSGVSMSFSALVSSSTFSRKLLTRPLAKLPPLPAGSLLIPLLLLALRPTAQAHQESHCRDDQEYDEQYLGDAGGTDGNAAETEERGNQRNDEEDCGIVKHVGTSVIF